MDPRFANKIILSLVELAAPEKGDEGVSYIPVPGDDEEEQTALDLVMDNEYELEELLTEYSEFGDAARMADSNVSSLMTGLQDLQAIWLELVDDGPLQEAAQKIDDIIAELTDLQTFTQTISMLVGEPSIDEQNELVEHKLPEGEALVGDEEEEEGAEVPVLDEEDEEELPEDEEA